MAIGEDDALAAKWIAHDDPTRPFMPVRHLVTRTLGSIEADEELIDVECRTYRQLCVAKHANPLLQKQLGIDVGGSAVTVFNGPDCSDESIRGIWFGLEHAARLASFAARGFVQAHIRGASPELTKQIEALERRRMELRQRAKDRWGTDDPCPGRW